MEYLAEYKNLLIIVSSVSVLTFIASLVIIPIIIINLSPDYFYGRRKPMLPYRNAILRYIVLIFKNMLGYFLLLMGLVMLFIPGQGLLSITLGIMLINFPGKKKLEIKFFSNKKVLNVINSIRQKAGRESITIHKSDRF